MELRTIAPAIQIAPVTHLGRRVPWAVIGFAALVCLFYYPVVFQGRTLVPLGTAGVMGEAGPYPAQSLVTDKYHLDPGASEWQFVPWAAAVGRAYASGQLPLWNPDQGFGAPLLANGQSGALDLLRLPVFLIPGAPGWDVYYLVRSLLGLLASYAFARSLGLRSEAAYVVAIAYVFSGHFILLGNAVWIEAYYLLPVNLLGVEYLARRRWRPGFGITLASALLVLLVGMPEVSFFVAFCGVAYALYRLALVPEGDTGVRARVRSLVVAAAAWLLGIALAMPLLLPLFEYVANSSDRLSGRSSIGVSHAQWSDAIIWIIPYLKGLPVDALGHFSAGTYVGAAVLTVAAFGMIPDRSPIYRRTSLFALPIALLLLGKIYGVPLLNDVGRLPILETFHFDRYAPPIVAFCLALLAGVGAQRLLTNPPRRRVAALALAVVFVGASLGAWLGASDGSVSLNGDTRLWVTLAFTGWASVALLAALARRIPKQVLGFGLCCVVFVELAALSPIGAYQARRDPLARPPYVDFFYHQPIDPPFRIFATDGLLYPNFATGFGLQDIRAVDALYPNRYLRFVNAFLAPGIGDRYVGSPIGSDEAETRIENNPWFDLAGVRYVVTANGSRRAPSSGPTSATSSGRTPASADVPQPQYARVYRSEVQIFSNRDALPRAFLVSSLRVVPDASTAIAVMQGQALPLGPSARQPVSAADRQWVAAFEQAHGHAPTDQDWADRDWSLAFLQQHGHPPTEDDWKLHAQEQLTVDPRSTAVVEGIPKSFIGSGSLLSDSAVIQRDTAESVVIDVQTAGRGFLVLADQYYPGWIARVDGTATPIYPTDLAFRGIFVPAGHHVVVFSYEPSSFRWGLIVAGVAVILTVLALVALGRLDEYRR